MAVHKLPTFAINVRPTVGICTTALLCRSIETKREYVAGNATFLKSNSTLAWLGQFAPDDQLAAASLLRAMALVSRDQFAENLSRAVLHRVESGKTPVGLYVERELRHRKGVPHRLFKQSTGKVKRAYGAGPPPVQPTKAYDPSVGSEGLVAHIVSELCRQHPKKIFIQPGPDQIRKYAIRRFILVTDYIGSGNRAWRYIEAAWRVRSVRSWWSARATKGLAFEVVAYAASPSGRSKVERHPSHPTVRAAVAGPTVGIAFGSGQRSAIRSLCIRYSPMAKEDAMGYGSVGALIAFAHGIPNNAPLILHKKGANWQPLFPARITSASRADFGIDDNKEETIREHFLAMRQKKLAEAGWVTRLKPQLRTTLFVMAALSQRPRDALAVSSRTGLVIMEVEQALCRALSHGWIDGRNRLTDDGHGQLVHAEKDQQSKSVLPDEPEEFYYPTMLRAPAGVSS